MAVQLKWAETILAIVLGPNLRNIDGPLDRRPFDCPYFLNTRRYGPLFGPTSSSCEWLQPRLFLPSGKKRAYYARFFFVANFRPFGCSVVTLIIFSSNLN